jgi:NADH dehydrogenase
VKAQARAALRHAASAARARPRIAVLGANFAGLAAVRGLGREADVTVVDRSPWFEWLPNIHELLSGVKRPADLRLPRARLVESAGHRFLRAEVAELDARAGRLVTSRGRRLDFDLCLVAVGGEGETWGVRGADRHALPFKTVDDCARIGRRLRELARSGGGHVVIVGGGLEGVEALGEILRRWRRRGGLRVTVVEGGPRLLPDAPVALDAAVRSHCRGREVELVAGTRVVAVTPRGVRLDSGRTLRADLTIWTGGVTAPALLQSSGLAVRRGQWAPVDDTLRSTRHDNVFVAGDAAGLPAPLAKQAYYALQMGECAAGNLRRALAGRPLRAFEPDAKPMLVAFGDLDTFLVTGRGVVASPALAAAKEAVLQLTLAQLDPPLRPAALAGLTARLAGAAGALALPALGSRAGRAGLRRLQWLPGAPVRCDD